MSWILINIFTKTCTCVYAPLSSFFSPVNYPLLKLIWYRLQGYTIPRFHAVIIHRFILALKATSVSQGLMP